jgi:hypothetical protein
MATPMESGRTTRPMTSWRSVLWFAVLASLGLLSQHIFTPSPLQAGVLSDNACTTVYVMALFGLLLALLRALRQKSGV